MELRGLSGGIYQPLSQRDIETIHQTSLTILEQTGIAYEQGLKETAEMLAQAGARVDTKQSRIRFPRDLVLAQVNKAPQRVVLYGRRENCDLDLTGHQVHLGTGGAAVKVLDIDTGQIRSTVLEDIYRIGRIVDKLDNIHFYLRPCIPTDIAANDYDVNCFYACLKSTGKHIMVGLNDENGFHQLLEMASLVAGGRAELTAKPFVSVVTSNTISPLKMCTQSTRIMQEAIRHGIPVALSSAPMAGSTSPVTMAGTLAQLHAEQLYGITLCQLTSPGAPLLYGGIPATANLSTMGYRGGAVECGMMNAAIHQLAHHIEVPNYNSSGLTDSKLPDSQAAYEKSLTTLLAAMAGSNYIHHAAGMIESMIAVAYEQYIIDDEIIGMTCKVLKGIEVDPEHLALEVIDSVGPGGNFMTAPHTMTHMRSEYFAGNGITDSKIRDRWEKEGSRDTRQRAREMAKAILNCKESPCIPEDVDRAIRAKFNILL